MFSWPNKCEYASFGRNKTSVELVQKKPSRHTLYIFYATPKQENFQCRKKKHYRPANFFKKILRNVGWKISVGLLHDRCRLLSFRFNPLMKYAWCRQGNVRSASCGDASILDLDRSSFLADVDCQFFRSILTKNIFLPRWANVFLAE